MNPTLSLRHPAVLLIDLQEGFFETRELAEARPGLVANCNQLVDDANVASVPVFNVRTEYKRDKSTWTLKMLEDDQGYLFEGTYQAQALEELNLQGTIELVKRRDSAFWNTELLTLALQYGVSCLILAGVSSETCIAATATDAFSANLPVLLARDALASADPQFEDVTLQFLENHYRQEIRSTRELIAYLREDVNEPKY